jgi:hypothetical protein
VISVQELGESGLMGLLIALDRSGRVAPEHRSRC